MLSGKKILITGGTGTLGRALTKKLLKDNIDTIRIFSRDEGKQLEMATTIDDNRLRFIIGDVRDKERLSYAMEGIDILFHIAALKQVPVAEYNPFEAIKTNVLGSQNVLDASIHHNVDLAMAISSDKAVSPLNTYGATKLLMERMFTAANFYKGKRKTIFTSVRYGNVLGSRGSVVPQFLKTITSSSKIHITDPKMTRFNITLTEALELIYRGLTKAIGGEVFVPKLKAYRLDELAQSLIETVGKEVEINYSSIRTGEKLHESMINEHEAPYTIESEGMYIILSPELYDKNWSKYMMGKKNCLQGNYSSDRVDLLTKDEIKMLINKEIFDDTNPYRPLYN
ncbi:MAG: polysaccharide biosynthesis protein [Candidatus Nitrosocosmicus sp.]|nr:polysaccharide biosynthesis protein [Candidatus Nitrosocosmicus sp.]